ncbi:MAG TPA: hypothetical protein G4O12_06715 [Dehalococcoidia bacterium]|nr:hypothetical protein [Dehalococcoidia bacterium]
MQEIFTGFRHKISLSFLLAAPHRQWTEHGWVATSGIYPLIIKLPTIISPLDKMTDMEPGV